jgi:hypothetical protein
MKLTSTLTGEARELLQLLKPGAVETDKQLEMSQQLAAQE